MKVSDLTGPQLDYWVAKAEGFNAVLAEDAAGVVCWIGPDKEYGPSSDWGQGGPIIERERIQLRPPGQDGDYFEWTAGGLGVQDRLYGRGPTPLIAAMRAFVASKFGPEVPDA